MQLDQRPRVLHHQRLQRWERASLVLIVQNGSLGYQHPSNFTGVWMILLVFITPTNYDDPPFSGSGWSCLAQTRQDDESSVDTTNMIRQKAENVLVLMYDILFRKKMEIFKHSICREAPRVWFFSDVNPINCTNLNRGFGFAEEDDIQIREPDEVKVQEDQLLTEREECLGTGEGIWWRLLNGAWDWKGRDLVVSDMVLGSHNDDVVVR